MDRRGGCCIARYQNGSVYDLSKVDRIMLKFRPIAPKPVTGSPMQSNEEASSKSIGPGKRKYNKENNNNNKQKKNNTRRQKANSEKKNISISNMRKKANWEETHELTRKTSSDSVVTLSLLPETPERKETIITVKEEKSLTPFWLSFAPSDYEHLEKQTAVMAPVKAVTSIVTVECVTDTWLDNNMNLLLGCNDHEKMVTLGKDTCPGFISDGVDRVWWTNRAYGEMVGSEEVIVWLVMKERVLSTRNAFSCRVRVRSTCRMGEGATTMVTYPCDVWRMDGGGFAWRFDVEAALSLGFRV